MKKNFLAAALLGSALASAPAFAQEFDLTGSTVTGTLFFPDNSTVYAGPVTATVGSGIEFASGSFAPAPQSVNIGANTISLFTNGAATYSTSSFNGFQFDFTGFRGSLSDLRVSNTSTFRPVGFSVVGNSVRINLSGLTVRADDVLQLAAVPEPATWGMMILGFGAMGFAMRRRAKVRANVSFA